MQKMGDWIGDPKTCDYVRKMEEIYTWGYETEVEYLTGGYVVLWDMSGTLAGVKIGAAILTGTISIWGECLLTLATTGVAIAELTLSGIEAKWHRLLAEAFIEAVSYFHDDLNDLDKMLVDAENYIKNSFSDPLIYPHDGLSVMVMNVNIPDIIVPEGQTSGRETGSISIENTGLLPVKVNVFVDIIQVDNQGGTNVVTVTGPTEIKTLDRWEADNIYFDYVVPVSEELFGHCNKYRATIYVSYGTKWEKLPFTGDAVMFYVHGENTNCPNVQTETLVVTDSITQGESDTSYFVANNYQTTFMLDYGGSDLDLHLYDNQGRHTGLNYMTEEVETEIPNSFYSGSFIPEIITIHQSSGQEYTIEVVGIETEGHEDFLVTAIETPESPPAISAIPPNLWLVAAPCDTADGLILIREVGGHHDVEGIVITPKDLTDNSHVIPSSNIFFDTSFTAIPAGSGLETAMRISIPQDAINGNDGAINGARWTTGQSGPALDFDGDTAYVLVPDAISLDITDDITISTWFNVAEEDSGEHTIVCKEGAYLLAYQNEKIHFYSYTDDLLFGSTSIQDSRWYHVVAVRSGDSSKVYLNGDEDGATSNSGSMSINNNPLYIGSDSTLGDHAFNGIIDEVLVFHRALSEAEIQALYIGLDIGELIPDLRIPKEFSLYQNYPNPFNPITTIEYALPKDCRVNLQIYNILGQRVITLVDDEQIAGYKSIHWNSRSQSGNEVSSGLYFYRLQAGDFVETRKMILLK